MSEEKFIEDCEIVFKFTQYYCDHKHEDLDKDENTLELNYNDHSLQRKISYRLCKECEHTVLYSYKKLQDCPFPDKPSCRKCKQPCYEKKEWKNSAKIMKYSGMQLGLTKIKKLFNIKKAS